MAGPAVVTSCYLLPAGYLAPTSQLITPPPCLTGPRAALLGRAGIGKPLNGLWPVAEKASAESGVAPWYELAVSGISTAKGLFG
jgi:hypothetical protein